MSNKISIDVISDYVCPWCYIAKRRLEKAIAARPDLQFSVAWQPFQLSPDMPREGRDRRDYYAEIFGAERAMQIMASMRDTGVDEGIAFDTLPDARAPNTLAAHMLMLWASENSAVDTALLAEKLFHAHHVACEDIGNQAVLIRIAAEAGMNKDEVAANFTSGLDEDRVMARIQTSVKRGISGVPFFVFDNRFGLSGAQPVDEFLGVFEQLVKQDLSA